MTTKQGLSIRKPISLWNQPLSVDFKAFFKSLTKATLQGIGGAWGNAAKDAIDALSAVGFKNDLGQTAWILIQRSLSQAIYTLVEENLELIKESPYSLWNLREQPGLSSSDFSLLLNKLDLSLEQNELVIDDTVFKHPRDLIIVRSMQKPFYQWLEGVGLTEAQAKAISARLPAYFVFALNDEWHNKRSDYTSLKDAFNTPFTKASEREQSWFRYSAWLQKQIDEPLFYESFSLNQVYIPLRTFIDTIVEVVSRVGKDKEGKEILVTNKVVERAVVDIEETLSKWLDKPEPDDAIKVISGGPGYGKSSFAKMFAARQTLENERRVLFVPLYRFEPGDDLVQAIGDFVNYEGFFSHNPIDPITGESRLLIIFDGLDELSMQGKIASEVSQRFVQEVQRKVDRFNYSEPRLKILITGRELAVQSNAGELRRPQQVLHLLPYYLTATLKKELGLDPRTPEHHSEIERTNQRVLSEDLRDRWWRRYGEASGRGYHGMPQVLGRDELVEITSQPLLNYLVALSFDRGEIDFAKENNINAIYEDLLKAVYQRVWARPHPATAGVSEDQFVRLLEEVAVSTWHGQGRTTTLREIESHCDHSGLKLLLEKFQEGAKEGVARLLLAFYFRKSGNRITGDETFEFTHKSFGEYLTARRIVGSIRRLHDELERSQGAYDTGWNERDALTYWIKLCGPVNIDRYLFKFLINELRLQQLSDVIKWQQTLIRLVLYILRYGSPMERLDPRPTFREEVEQSRNSEETLLASLNACARFTKIISRIEWPSQTSLAEWISRLQGHKYASEDLVFLSSLGYLNIEECVLQVRDLSHADLSLSSMYKADLSLSNLEAANLQKTNLRNVKLRSANLQGANLQGADLEGANLQGANLKKANLQDANLKKAQLSNADFEGARLTGINFHGANPQSARFHGVNFKGVIWNDGRRIKDGSITHLTFEKDL